MSHDLKIDMRPLYGLTQYLIMAMLLLIPLQIITFVIAPPPNTVEGFFELFRQNPLLGLLSLDLLYLFNNLILAVIYLALFALLYRERPVTLLLALVLGLIGIACYYPSNPSFEMLTLSGRYFLVSPDRQSIYVAAGEALMAGYAGTTFNVYYVLSTVCLLLFSYAIIKSPEFKKTVGLWGLASGFFMIIPSSAGTIGMIFSLLSLIPWVVFVALLRVQFKKYAKGQITKEGSF